jgi:hypothetical protein
VYTITCASASCTSAELADIQTAVNDAQRGDTIRLEAGRTWTSSSGPAVWLDRTPSGSNGRVVITSTQEAKLPAAGTRITPVYAPLMPRLEITASNGPFFAVAHGYEGGSARVAGTPATHWEFRGLEFWINRPVLNPVSSSSITSGFIRVGSLGQVWAKASESAVNFSALTVASNVATATLLNVHGLAAGDKIRMAGLTGPAASLNGIQTITAVPTSTTLQFAASGVADGTYTENTMYFAYPADAEQLPDDIVIDRCIFRNGGLSLVRRDLLLSGKSTTVSNSFIAAARETGADSQNIAAIMAPGPLTITNNYIASPATENIMFGGDRNPLEAAVGAGTQIKYNYIAHPPLEARTRTWTLLKNSGDFVFRGRMVRPSSGGSYYYVATTAGTIGSSEPAWCLTPGCTVTDGTVTWERHAAISTCTWCIKNSFEVKSAEDLTFSHNVVEYMWSAGQSRAINIKGDQYSVYGNPTFGNLCAPSLSGTVNTNGNTVTANTGTFPWIGGPFLTLYGTNPKNITINGVVYTVSSFDSATRLTLTGSAGIQNNAAFSYGSDPALRKCVAGSTKNILLAHNIVRNQSAPLVLTNGGNALLHNIRGVTIRHNLFQKTDPLLWTNEIGNPYSSATASIFANPMIRKTTFEHNTILADNASWAIFLDNDAAIQPHPGDTVFRNNVFGLHTTAAVRSNHTDAALFICGGTVCPPSQWSNNVFAGANLTTYSGSPGSVSNLCPSSSGCRSPNFGLLFRDFDHQKLDVKPGTAFSRRASDGADYGADVTQLPEIRELSVTPTDHMVLFEYRVTQPISHIACVVEVSTRPDFATYAGELGNIANYPRQDSDDADPYFREGLQRMIAIGRSVPLTAGTQHYYRLHCGGDVRTGTFTTLGMLSGVQERTFTFRASSSGTHALSYGYQYSRTGGGITDAQTETVDCAQGDSCSIRYAADRGKILYWRSASGPIHAEAIR